MVNYLSEHFLLLYFMYMCMCAPMCEKGERRGEDDGYDWLVFYSSYYLLHTVIFKLVLLISPNCHPNALESSGYPACPQKPSLTTPAEGSLPPWSHAYYLN